MKYSVNQVKAALGEVQNLLNWEVRMRKAPPAGGAFDPNLAIRIQTAEMPTPTTVHNKLQLGGHEINFRGKTTKAGTTTLMFAEGTDAKVLTYFLRLAQAYWGGDGNDTTGNSVETEQLKGDLEMVLLDGENATTTTLKLTGCLFTIDTSGSLGQESQSLIRSVTCEWDDLHITTPEISW